MAQKGLTLGLLGEEYDANKGEESEEEEEEEGEGGGEENKEEEEQRRKRSTAGSIIRLLQCLPMLY